MLKHQILKMHSSFFFILVLVTLISSISPHQIQDNFIPGDGNDTTNSFISNAQYKGPGAQSQQKHTSQRIRKMNEYNQHIQTHIQHNHYDDRSLVEDEFNNLNILFEGMVLGLPDTQSEQNLGGIFGTVLFQIANLKCFNLAVGDVQAYHSKQSARRISYTIEVTGIVVDCEFDWMHNYALGGFGKGSIKTKNNSIRTDLTIISDDFKTHPPSKVIYDECAANVNIRDMDFNGGLSGFIADIFEPTFRNDIEIAMRESMCDEMLSVTSTIDQAILRISAFVESFYGDIPEQFNNPLFGQSSLKVPVGVTLFDLTKADNPAGDWYRQTLINLSNTLGSTVLDTNNPSKLDLGINIYFRNNILNSKGQLFRTAFELGLQDEGVLFSGADFLTETTIKFIDVMVEGIDSVSRFDQFQVISPQTIQTNVKWDSIKVKLKIMVDSRPSAREDSVILESTFPRLIEYVTITFDIVDLLVGFSFLTAMDQNKLFNIQFASILEEEEFFRCVLSSYHEIKAAHVEYKGGQYGKPTMEGFIADGVDRVGSDSANALHSMYSDAIMKAMPSVFATRVHTQLNGIISDFLNNLPNIECPTHDTVSNNLVDFRDFFLNKDDAIKAGASGTFPYGNKSFQIKSQLDDRFSKPDALNNMIRPITMEQSNEAGTLSFPGEIINFTSNTMSIQVLDTKVENIDSFGIPEDFFGVRNDPFHLRSTFPIGKSKPVQGSVRMLVTLEDENGLEVKNELDLNLALSGATIFFNLLVKIHENDLLQFPLTNLANLQCWLATVPAPILDKNGIRVNGSTPNMAIMDFVFTFVEKMTLNVNCVSCTSPGMAELPRMIKKLKSAGVIRDLLQRFLVFMEEIVNSEYSQTYIDRLVSNARSLCPHNARFNINHVNPQYDPPPFPQLSEESLELNIISAGIAAQVALAIYALNLDSSLVGMDPLSGEAAIEALNLDTTNLQNLSTLEGTLGRMINNSLGLIVDDPRSPSGKDLKINFLMRSKVLDDENVYSLKPDGISLPIDSEFQLDLTEIRIQGLDSFLSTNLYKAIAPHTIQNHFVLEYIALEFNFSIRKLSSSLEVPNLILAMKSEDLKVRVQLDNVRVGLTLMLALDKAKTDEIQLGSLLDTSTALYCLLSNTYTANITQVSLEPENVGQIKFEGLLSEDMERILSTSAETIISEYIPNFSSSLEAIARNGLNNALEEYIIQSEIIRCPRMDLIAEFVDLRDLLLKPDEAVNAGGFGTMPYGDLFYTWKENIDTDFLSPNEKGSPKINDVLIRPLMSDYSFTEDVIFLPGDVFAMDMEDGTKISFTDVRFENLDSVGYPIQFLHPENGIKDSINNELTIGVDGKVFRAWSKIYVTVHENGFNVLNEIDVSVKLNSTSLFSSILARIDERALKQLPLRKINDPNCWIATIPPPRVNRNGVPEGLYPTLSLNSFSLSYDDIELKVNCVSCPSADVQRISTLSMIFNNPQALARFLDKFISGPVLQEKIDAMQHEATLNCGFFDENIQSNSPNTSIQQSAFTDDTYKAAVTFFALGLLAIAITSGFSIGIKYMTLQNHKKWLISLGEHDIFLLYKKQIEHERKEKCLSDSSKSIIARVSNVVRVIFIALIGSSFFFFAAAHAFSSAFIEMTGHLSSQKIAVPEFYKTSVISFVLDAWNAGSSILAIALLAFSVLFSYVKQFITLVLWCIPPSKFSVKKRGYVLKWIEGTTKWSMVSAYLFTIFFASLGISIKSPENLPEGYFSIKLKVVPLWGLCANVVAQLISHMTCHMSVFYHEKIVLEEQTALGIDLKSVDRSKWIETDLSSAPLDQFEISENVSGHLFKLRGPKSGQRMKISNGVNVIVILAAFVSIFMLIIGIILPSLKVEIFGVLGLVYEASNGFEEAVIHHSILSILRLLVHDSMDLESSIQTAGMIIFTIILFFSAIIIPFLLVTVLLCIWFVPMKKRFRKRLTRGVEILQSWKYLEVYIISLIFASWQLDGISSSILDSDYCASFRRAFTFLVYYDVLSDTNMNQCLYNKVFVGYAALSLILSSILLAFLTHFVIKATAQKQNDDVDKSFDLKDNHCASVGEIDVSSMINLIKLHPTTQFTDSFGVLLTKHESSASYPIANYKIGPQHDSGIPVDQEIDLSIDQGIETYTNNPSWASSWSATEISDEMKHESDEYFL